MKFVKLFEEFEFASNVNPGNPQTLQPKKYIYYIKDIGKSKFEAAIRDEDGKVIFEFDDTLLKNEQGMKDENDIPGLIELLINKNKIKRGDLLEPSEQTAAIIKKKSDNSSQNNI